MMIHFGIIGSTYLQFSILIIFLKSTKNDQDKNNKRADELAHFWEIKKIWIFFFFFENSKFCKIFLNNCQLSQVMISGDFSKKKPWFTTVPARLFLYGLLRKPLILGAIGTFVRPWFLLDFFGNILYGPIVLSVFHGIFVFFRPSFDHDECARLLWLWFQV